MFNLAGCEECEKLAIRIKRLYYNYSDSSRRPCMLTITIAHDDDTSKNIQTACLQ